ncbi:MAG TPA: protein-methionine-sulfoxide reductase heme-binding subunit MsrQ [Vicinamibacterales bacterium]|nr:protein-methionine-sulfoxide reductase heme-binding subunit MsrQ [Vicinamibacterales bacterium]
MTQTQLRRWVVKPIVWVLCLTPLALLVYGLYLDLGANPVETITNTTGIWTLRLIAITLAITPLRWLTGLNQLINYRRLAGLFAFFYGSLHFLTYALLDHQFDPTTIWEDVRLRPYITAGFTAFVLMIPLALTSTAGWIRRLGGKNWNRLHMLIYITAAAAVLHYYWKVSIKMPPVNPRNYGILVAVLLGFRVWRYFARRRASEV